MSSFVWGIDYSYDRFGNRLSAIGSASTPNFQSMTLTIDPSTNRIVDPGWEYDAAGNVVEDGGLHHFRWDSAGRLIELGPPQPSGSGPPGDDGRCTGEPGCPPPPPPPPDPDPPLDDGRSSGGFKAQAAGTMLYEYDYQGRRVVKDEGGSGRIYFWDEVLGEVIWEFPLEAPASQDVVRGFLNGRLVVENDTRPGGGLHFMHRDHLGTSKLVTDFFSGAKVCDETYHPFGQVQSQQPTGCNGHVRKFTGKERDPESGMDYFGARYSDKVIGRFISVDPLLDSAVLELPQSWNRYAYVLNQPLKLVDPDGRQVVVSRRQLEEQIRFANEAIDAIPLLPEGFKVALKLLFVPSTPEEALMQSLPFPSAMASVGVSKLTTSQLGAARVRKVAEIIGGTALESAESQGLNVVLRNVGGTDVDVLGPLGELIVVGGPAKASNLSNLGQKLMILKEAAKEKGVQAIAFFTEETPEEVLNLARRWLGEENVRLFEDIVNQ